MEAGSQEARETLRSQSARSSTILPSSSQYWDCARHSISAGANSIPHHERHHHQPKVQQQGRRCSKRCSISTMQLEVQEVQEQEQEQEQQEQQKQKQELQQQRLRLAVRWSSPQQPILDHAVVVPWVIEQGRWELGTRNPLFLDGFRKPGCLHCA